MENIRRYFKRTDKTYLLLCIFSSVMAVTALSSWAAKQGNGFAVDEITGQITGLGDYRRAAVARRVRPSSGWSLRCCCLISITAAW